MHVFIVITLLLLTLSPTAVRADDDSAPFDTLTLYWENDIFAGTDRDYTNGLKLTWSTPFVNDRKKSKLPDWSYSLLEIIPFNYDGLSDQALTINLGQNIYTPRDTSRVELVPDDRPYAGHMYIGAGIHTRNGRLKHVWEVNLGIVGPSSYAGDLQRWLHEQTGSDRANGWDNQLGNEVTLDIGHETKWRILHRHGPAETALDLITHLGFRLGNVAVYANTGFELRYGWNLPNNFGICIIRGSCELNSALNSTKNSSNAGFHLFLSADGRAVARDLFLDGNTFEASHSVDREPLVGDLVIGFAFNAGNFTSTYSYIFRTRQFKEQDSPPEYGAISFSFSY